MALRLGDDRAWSSTERNRNRIGFQRRHRGFGQEKGETESRVYLSSLANQKLQTIAPFPVKPKKMTGQIRRKQISVTEQKIGEGGNMILKVGGGEVRKKRPCLS